MVSKKTQQAFISFYRGGGEHGGHLLTPPPIPMGILYCREFRSHQEIKMAASQAQRSTLTISRKNKGILCIDVAAHVHIVRICAMTQGLIGEPLLVLIIIIISILTHISTVSSY